MKSHHLLAALLAAGLFTACGKREETPAPATPSAAENATNPPAPVSTSSANFEKLKGRWLRPDGGYILEIRTATAAGKLEAGYFNPKPIHVARAEASGDAQTLKVFVELRDVNYPGSTYTLVYRPEMDQLTGTYFQAALGQNFEVEFVRQP